MTNLTEDIKKRAKESLFDCENKINEKAEYYSELYIATNDIENEEQQVIKNQYKELFSYELSKLVFQNQ